jgi:peptidoglycan/xylan/chitin deacetylase (PgdA/CDA1 family)
MRKVVKRGAHAAVKVAAGSFDRVARPPSGVVILAYHRVGGGTDLELDLEPQTFDEQMAWLASNASPATIDSSLDLLNHGEGDDAVVVTFDDGTADFIEHALPSLVEHRVPATYYLATAFIEEQRPFPDNGTPMTWNAVREAVSTGLVTVGSHTHSHAVFDKLDPQQALEEIRRSRELIENRLGVPAVHFAYPKGVFGGERNEAHIAEHFRSAALANCGVNVYGSTNDLRLDRSPIQRGDGMTFFKKKAQGGMRLEGQLRALLNRRRYDAATN